MDKCSLENSLKPSGLNHSFFGEGLAFDQYIEVMKKIIIESRLDLNGSNANEIVECNSPFSWVPDTENQIINGVLLIHGLFDSPFYLRDLGHYFLAQEFLVRSILLPGHGTVAGDLLNIDYQEWVKAVQYGIDSLAKEVDQIFLAGYSLGGLLAIHNYLNSQIQDKIKGMILFAPALKPRSRIKHFFIKHYKFFNYLPHSKWYQLKELMHFTKYSCYAKNAAIQAGILIEEVNKALRKKIIDVPIFIIISSDDETICDKEIFSFFNHQKNSNNRLLVYTNNDYLSNDQRIINCKSHFPQLNIINFSHTCITIAPENPHLGSKSQLLDLQHYRNMPEITPQKIYLGAATKENLKQHTISRLTYNPDFPNLLQHLDDFLLSIAQP